MVEHLIEMFRSSLFNRITFVTLLSNNKVQVLPNLSSGCVLCENHLKKRLKDGFMDPYFDNVCEYIQIDHGAWELCYEVLEYVRIRHSRYSDIQNNPLYMSWLRHSSSRISRIYVLMFVIHKKFFFRIAKITDEKEGDPQHKRSQMAVRFRREERENILIIRLTEDIF